MLIAVGDLHIDKLESKIPGTADRILATLRTVFERGIEAGYDTFLLLGDVFDIPNPDDVFKIKLVQLLHEFRHLRVLVLMGNHDFASVRTHALRVIGALFRIGVLRGALITKPQLATLHGDRYWFCPHPYIVPAPETVRYSFGHYGYDGAKGDNGFVVRNNHAPAGRWVLGDYHTAQRGRNYAYVGSLTQLGWSENPRKYYAEIGDAFRLVRAPTPYVLRKTVIRTADDLATLDAAAWWQVAIAPGVDLPPNWQAAHPHVVSVTARTSKADSAAARALIKQQTDDDPLAMLRPLLLERGVLNDAQIERAMQMVESYR